MPAKHVRCKCRAEGTSFWPFRRIERRRAILPCPCLGPDGLLLFARLTEARCKGAFARQATCPIPVPDGSQAGAKHRHNHPESGIENAENVRVRINYGEMSGGSFQALGAVSEFFEDWPQAGTSALNALPRCAVVKRPGQRAVGPTSRLWRRAMLKLLRLPC